MDTQATLLITNAKIWTGNQAAPRAEALAIAGDKILAVGTAAEITQLAGPTTRIIDADGKFITPGFNDAHLHFLGGGFNLASVQLRDAATREEFVRRIGEYTQTLEAGTWITGGDWDHTLWGGELPTRDWIDAVTPENPVWINRLDGHMALANSLALQIAGIYAGIADIDGGTIVRDTAGVPTGILKDNAMPLVDKFQSEPPDSLKFRALAAAMEYVNRQGVTSIGHMGTWDDLRIFEAAHQKKQLTVRISAAVPLGTWEKLAEKVTGNANGDEWLRWGGLKEFMDGSLGSHTAAFFEPFIDDTTNSGLLVNDPEAIYQLIQKADAAGLQVMIHAIGDRAISLLLDNYARATAENGPRDRRFRIEHSQHIDPKDFVRYRDLAVIASMQPYHCIDDGRWAESYIGYERCKTTYAFRSLADHGVTLAFGSDWYVAPPTPLEGIYAAVTRRTLDDKNPDGWIPAEKLTVDEALRAYTSAAAYASFEENIKGSLEPGKLADFVVIDCDLTAIPPETIRDVQVLMTVVGGKIVFEKK
ncbi:MAG: amidohydrolase [Candidatus Neomarinimicrobiota bacterium]